MSSSSKKKEGRLREHPAKRFAPRERKIDIDDCYDDLIGEPHEATDGHRQITIAHHDSLTLTLFHFSEGSRLPEHQVDGAVTIQVLEGELEVSTDDNTHHLDEGQLVILGPKVEHDVHALAESRMLLTVHLHRNDERSTVNPAD